MKNPISRLLIFGSGLYFLMGVALLYSTGGEPLDFLGFLMLPIFSSSVGLGIEKLKVSSAAANWAFVLCLQLTVVFHYFLFPHQYQYEHIFSSILMLIAAVDCVLILPKEQNRINLLSTSVFTIGFGLYFHHAQSLWVTAPVILLLLWKYLLREQLEKIIASQQQERQFQAFQATVVSLNHEFNNVVGICEAAISKGAWQKFTEEDAQLLKRNLRRLVDLIKRLRNVERYEELEYFEGRKMLHIPELSEKE
jgi:hypothetical protein